MEARSPWKQCLTPFSGLGQSSYTFCEAASNSAPLDRARVTGLETLMARDSVAAPFVKI